MPTALLNWPLLGNSLLVATLTTGLALVLGITAAIWLGGLTGRRQTWLLAGIIAALAMPPFLVVNSWLDLLGTNSWLGSRLPEALKIYSLGGTIAVLAGLLWPIPCLAAAGAWQRLQAEYFEAEPRVRGWRLINGLLWPAARRPLAFAAAAVFILALNNFAVPAILQVKVLPAEVWVEFNTRLDNWAALRTGWPLIVAAGMLLWLLSRQPELSWPRQGRPFAAALLRQQLGRGLHYLCACSTLLALGLSVVLPLGELLGGMKTWHQFTSVEAAGWQALFNSFWLAAGTATLTTLAGILTGMVASQPAKVSRWAALVWLPFFVPGVLLGIALISSLNRGILTALYQSQAVMLLALTCRYAAPGWHGALLAVTSADRDLVDAGRLLGARGFGLFRLSIWPQAAAQLAAAWYVVYLLCLWDVETLVLIQPPGGETLALRAFNLLHYGHNAQVNALCLWLLILAGLPLAAAAGWRWWNGSRQGKEA